MWVRLSQDEISKIQTNSLYRARSWRRRILIALGWSTGLIILFALGFRGGSTRLGVLFLSSAYQGPLAPLMIMWLILTLLIIPIVTFVTGRNRGILAPGSGLCAQCLEPGHYHDGGRCGCGGVMEPFGYYRWTDDESSPEA
jgi:hypothetical protein